MAIYVRPEIGPPLPVEKSDVAVDLPVLVSALNNTLTTLCEHGLNVPAPTVQDVESAEGLLVSYASNPEMVRTAISAQRIGTMTPAALRHLDRLLTQFGTSAVGDASQIRAYVTNKLLEESDSPDPRIRLKALELLGKISEVGLFADRKEVTITHQTTEDLRDSLRAKLGKLVRDDVIDAEVVETPKLTLDLDSIIDRLGD